MELAFLFLGGVIFGIILTNVFRLPKKSLGTLDIDYKNELATLHLDGLDLTSRKIKRIILKVNHNADLSQN